MRARVTLAVVALVLVAGVATSWILERGAVPQSVSASGGYHVRVTRDGRELASYDLAALKAVGEKRVVAQGSAQVGPALVDVLKCSGVSEFSAVTVIGMGARDGGRLELTASQVGTDCVLAIAKRGTAKLAGPKIPSGKRVRDVTELQVR